MSQSRLSRWFGINSCIFGCGGVWGAVQAESWATTREGKRGEPYSVTVQFKTCPSCNAVDRRVVCGGRS